MGLDLYWNAASMGECLSVLGARALCSPWHAGTNWIVQTTYFQKVLKMDIGEEIPTYTLQWRFGVEEESDEGVVISVEDMEDPNVSMRLVFRQEDGSIQYATLNYVAQDEPRSIQAEYAGQGMPPSLSRWDRCPTVFRSSR